MLDLLAKSVAFRRDSKCSILRNKLVKAYKHRLFISVAFFSPISLSSLRTIRRGLSGGQLVSISNIGVRSMWGQEQP